MRLWPSKKEKAPENRDSDLSYDQWSSYFSHNGNMYPSNAFGSPGLYAFGGYPSDASTGATENTVNDFMGYVNGAYKASGVIFACSLARMMLFSEARFAFQDMSTARPGDLVPGDLSILEQPWPGGSSSSLLARAIQDVDMGGNSYLVRQGDRIWRLRPDWTMILLSGDPHEDPYAETIAYVFKPNGTTDSSKWEIYPTDWSNGTVAHWAPIPDPEACYRGMSWMTPVLREIAADKAISLHKVKYFQNGAKPGVIVSYDTAVTPQQLAEFSQKFNETKVGVDNAYRPLFLGGGATVTNLGTDAEAFKEISSAGEVRIAAAARVPAVIAGISEGMQGSSLNAGNFSAAKGLFADGLIRPLWGSFCQALQPLVELPENTRLWYDDKYVAFLREDQEVVARRQALEASTLSSLVQAGYTPESAREYVRHNDISLLEHNGLYSVQLMPPGSGFDKDYKGSAPPPQKG